MEQKLKITARHRLWLEEELKYLQHTLQNEIPKMIEDALALGDPQENAEYEFVMLEKKKCIDKIAEYERILSQAVTVDDEGTEVLD